MSEHIKDALLSDGKVASVVSKDASLAPNLWKEELWGGRFSNGSIAYKKDKTYQNCWVKYGMVSWGDSNHGSVKGDNSRGYKFPLISNLKEYIEERGGLIQQYSQSEDKAKLAEELYRITPTINWKNYSQFRDFNYVGSRWYTHAYDAKGANLGGLGWQREWVFNFTENADTGANTKGISLPYLLAGSNILKTRFRFSTDVRITNAQGMFKALQVYCDLQVQDENGNKLESTSSRGLSPFVMIEMFKQTAGLITKTPDCIYWGNCHSAQEFISENWVIEEISSFQGKDFEHTPANIFTPNYPSSSGTFPNYDRRNRNTFSAGSLKKIGLIIDATYLNDNTFLAGSNNLEEVRMKNLNNVNWDFSKMTKLSMDSIIYMLDNIWDLAGKYKSGEDVNKTKTLVHHGLEIKFRALTAEEENQAADINLYDFIEEAGRKGWKVYFGGNRYDDGYDPSWG